MKILKKILRFLFLGVLSDFWTLPLAVFIAWKHLELTEALGLFPVLTPEKVSKLVPAVVLWLLVLFLSRAVNYIQNPHSYKFGLMKKGNETWEKLTPSEKFDKSQSERRFLAYLLAIILLAM